MAGVMDRGRAEAVVRAAVDRGRRAGAEVVATFSGGREAHARFARSEITSTGDVTNATLHVTCALGRRHGTFASNQTSDRSIERAVALAVELARLSPEDPEWLPPLPAQRYATVAGRDAATGAVGADARAAAVEAALSAARSADLEAAGFIEHADRFVTVATSGGLAAHYDLTEASFSSTLRTRDGGGSGWASARSYRAKDVDASAVAKVASQKAAASREAKALDPGRYTVVLEPEAVANLLQVFMGSMDARPADEGRSFFTRPGGGNKVGEKLFPAWMTLRSDPQDAQAPASPFDQDGLPLKPTTWVDKGTLKGLVHGRYWASKAGKAPTGTPSSVLLEGGSGSTEDLIKRVKRGLLVTRFWYIRHLDPQTMLVTGLTRDGLFLIEDGRVTAPVRNFRFNESPAAMLANAETAGSPVTLRAGASGWRIPPLLAHEFHMASPSDAV